MTNSYQPQNIDSSHEDNKTWDPESVLNAVGVGSHAISFEDRCTIGLKPAGSYVTFLRELRQEGELLRSDKNQPSLLIKPTWYNESLFKNAQSVYQRHFMSVNFAHLSGLLLLVRVDSIYRTLSSTGKSDSVAKLFRRYYKTLRHVKTWYEGDIFKEDSDAHRSLLIVRGMHNKVSMQFNQQDDADACRLKGQADGPSTDTDKTTITNNNNHYSEPMHLSQFDIMITQFAFVGLIVTRGKNVGLIDDFNRKDIESFLHFWRVIGYYLGANEKFNLCSYELKDIVGLCEAIVKAEYRESIKKNPIHEPPGIMSVNIVRSLKFIPMLTIYGIMRYLYELLGHGVEELENKRNWYSNLSYTLIKLVMSNLLGYRPLRSFNNGLTRLSVYLVGKVEDWFANRLESSYGQELRL